MFFTATVAAHITTIHCAIAVPTIVVDAADTFAVLHIIPPYFHHKICLMTQQQNYYGTLDIPHNT